MVVCARCPDALADDLPTDDSLQLHGFVSQGALLTTDNNFLAKTERGSLEFTEAAINVTKTLDERLRTGVQLFVRDLGPEGNYSAKFDFLYLDFRWRDWLGFRAGRVKLPYGLYNDTSDIDAVQPVVLLPQSVYSITSRDFLFAQTGVELYGYRSFDDAGALSYNAYAGTLYIPLPSSPSYVTKVDVPYVAGGRLLWETPIAGLRFGASALVGELDATITSVLMPTMPVAYELDATQWLASFEYVNEQFILASEYGRTKSNTASGGMATDVTSERGYSLAGFRWTPGFQTTLYYSILYPNVDDRSGREHHQHDAAAALRFDINPHWIFKLEGHWLRGTASLSPALNDDKPISELVNQWWLLAAKTTVYY
jgi:hypothetical protein